MGLGQWTGGRKYILTILPLGVVNGHADEYSKLLLGSITGCSPMTPIPLLKGECVIIVKKRLSNIRAWSAQLGASIVGSYHTSSDFSLALVIIQCLFRS